ncbi:unnamed protein product [Gongylonema pulchrum]|uniref:DRBM domain-containing protein n=1 Tax=Gongylonema pulchrum TaxID=637853 RepID=A0A183ERI4_9BILA|nr:unnamed protein product [Gongylonema pulchrum]
MMAAQEMYGLLAKSNSIEAPAEYTFIETETPLVSGEKKPVESIKNEETVSKNEEKDELLELINSGDESISKLFVPQTLEYTIFSMDLDGDQQCILTLRGPNEIKNSFCGFGRTEKDAKNWAARNALTHLELFLRNSALFPAKDAQKEKPPSGSQQKPPATTTKPTPGRCLLTDL